MVSRAPAVDGVTSANATLRLWAGVVLVLMLVTSIAGKLFPVIPGIVAAALAWLAGSMLWPGLGRQQRIQVVVLIGLGIAGLAKGAASGVSIDVERLLGQNQLIISMLASVGLLRLLNRPLDGQAGELPRGIGAYVRSMFGVHVFAAVINISALVIMADRVAGVSGLSRAQAQLLCRAFTMAAFYSPFIAGVALALAYTPGSSLALLVLFGIPLTLCGFAVLYLFARTGQVENIDEFRGYPVRPESLWLPALLGCSVLVLHLLAPALSVVTLVTMLTPVIVIVALLARVGFAGTREALVHFTRTHLPDMKGELGLFLSSGVLAAGLVAVSASTGGWTPFEQLNATTASLVLLGTILVSFIGIHPVIVVSTVAPLLAPIDPEPTLLALVFVMGWGIGCVVNPLSGTNLILHGRYGVDNWRLSRSNAFFGLIMYLFAVGFLNLYADVFM